MIENKATAERKKKLEREREREREREKQISLKGFFPFCNSCEKGRFAGPGEGLGWVKGERRRRSEAEDESEGV